MLEVNGKRIVSVRGGGVTGHVVRSHSGVKLGAYHGAGSLERAISRALEGSDGTDLAMGEWYGPGVSRL